MIFLCYNIWVFCIKTISYINSVWKALPIKLRQQKKSILKKYFQFYLIQVYTLWCECFNTIFRVLSVAYYLITCISLRLFLKFFKFLKLFHSNSMKMSFNPWGWNFDLKCLNVFWIILYFEVRPRINYNM